MALIGFDKKLKSSDFRLVEQRPADADGFENAQIHPDLEPSNFKMERSGTTVSIKSFDLKIRLIKKDTWMLQSHIADAELLHHEQGHYNIGTIAGRELYKKLLALHTSSVEDLQSQMNTTQNELNQKWDMVDKRYDKKTKHGQDADEQKKWDDKIEAVRVDPNGVLADLPL